MSVNIKFSLPGLEKFCVRWFLFKLDQHSFNLKIENGCECSEARLRRSLSLRKCLLLFLDGAAVVIDQILIIS